MSRTRSPERPVFFLGGLYGPNRRSANGFWKIAGGRLPWPDIDAGKALPWVEGKTGLSLAESQADAVRRALNSKAMVITGGPGVGKTTIVNAILRILDAKGVTLLLLRADRPRSQTDDGGHRVRGP